MYLLLVAAVLIDNHNFRVLNILIGNDLMSASFLNFVIYLDISGLTLLA